MPPLLPVRRVAFLAFLLAGCRAQAYDPISFIDPFIGTSNGGHVFAGSTLPSASVKAVADCLSSDNQGGFVSDGSPILGVSPLHDDGTGGGASLGQFKLLPVVCDGGLEGCMTDETARAVPRVNGSEAASPGFFSISLANGYTHSVTSTAHAALHLITSTNSSADTILLLDLSNDLQHSFQGSGNLTLLPSPPNSTTPTRLTGSGAYLPSFGIGSYSVHFCLDVAGVIEYAIYENGAINVGATGLSSTGSTGDQLGALIQVQPGPGPVMVRVGVSWTSQAKACAYAESELSSLTPTQFNATRSDAESSWRALLSAVNPDTTGTTTATQTLFWTSLYRAFISPTNITGDNPLWTSPEPYYDSFYCIWDSFRVVHPLWAIVTPGAQAEVVRALVDVYRFTGWLPDCRMSLDSGYTQGGSNADTLLADSYVKGITAGINWEDGYLAVKKDAESESFYWGVQGRGGIVSRAELGYIPVEDTTDSISWGSTIGRSASRLLEYAYNDFSIALMAKGLGNTADYELYLNRSMDAVHIWNNATESDGFTGFIQPRYSNGSFMYVDPRMCSPVLGHDSCFLNPEGGEFYEASSWQYSFYFPHNMAYLISSLMGGSTPFLDRLDTLFEHGYSDIGDEPGFLPTFLYNYAGRPDKTVDRVLEILGTNFNESTNGLPGNDDSGAMGAYVVWAMLGFYPVAGQTTYLLSTPLFPSVTFTNPVTGAVATISTTNWDGATTNKYVQSATLNGEAYTKNWITHELFSQGGTLELVLGSTPSDWGTADGDLPPSISTGGF